MPEGDSAFLKVPRSSEDKAHFVVVEARGRRKDDGEGD